jgi:hypothetical protein
VYEFNEGSIRIDISLYRQSRKTVCYLALAGRIVTIVRKRDSLKA